MILFDTSASQITFFIHHPKGPGLQLALWLCWRTNAIVDVIQASASLEVVVVPWIWLNCAIPLD